MSRTSSIVATVTPVLLILGVGYGLYGNWRSIEFSTPDAIEVRMSGTEGFSTTSEPERIARVMSFMHERRGGWGKTWHTSPSMPFTIVGRIGGTQTFVLWASDAGGGGTLGFRHGTGEAPDNVFRSVSQAEVWELLEMVGVKPTGR